MYSYSHLSPDLINTKVPVYMSLGRHKPKRSEGQVNYFQDNRLLHWPKGWGKDCGPIRDRWLLDGFMTCYWIQPVNPSIHAHFIRDNTQHCGHNTERGRMLGDAVRIFKSFDRFHQIENELPDQVTYVDVIETRIPWVLDSFFDGNIGRLFFIALRHPDKGTREAAMKALSPAPGQGLYPYRQIWEAHV